MLLLYYTCCCRRCMMSNKVVLPSCEKYLRVEYSARCTKFRNKAKAEAVILMHNTDDELDVESAMVGMLPLIYGKVLDAVPQATILSLSIDCEPTYRQCVLSAAKACMKHLIYFTEMGGIVDLGFL
jgi:hypothetical protein